MKIYTKTGDKGQTGLIGGTRVFKNDIRLEAYGTIDELNSFVGMLTSAGISSQELDFLRKIQHQLFTIGAHLATDTSRIDYQKASILNEDAVLNMEKEIDRMDEVLPVLDSFILPGGSNAGAICHVCRTITRRAERRLFDLKEIHTFDEQILIYINRLSDYFFVLSRYLTYNSDCQEFYWKTQDL